MKNIVSVFLVFAAVAALAFLAAALVFLPYPPGESGYRPGPKAAVSEIQIVLLESLPVKVNVVAKGYLPNSCYKVGKIETGKTPEGNHNITIWTDVKDSVCTQALVPFEQVIPLDVVGFPKGVYSVTVNGIPGNFELQMDNFEIDYWMEDSIHLMRNKEDGSFGCFGCGKPWGEQRICIDPAPVMEMVEETTEIHCSNDFQVIQVNGNVGAQCDENSDCRTPFSFMVQSNCPFGSACIDNECRVVCALVYHDPDPSVSKSYPFTCQEDFDCDCSERENRTIECRCVEGACVSVEA